MHCRYAVSIVNTYKLLKTSVELYWDDTGISSKKKCGPIWLGISNSDSSIKRTPESRMLIAVMPPETDLSPVLEELVSQIQQLTEVDFFCASMNSVVRFHCLLSLLLGDSPASNYVIGMSNGISKLSLTRLQVYVHQRVINHVAFATQRLHNLD